jgi:hypothetical protein
MALSVRRQLKNFIALVAGRLPPYLQKDGGDPSESDEISALLCSEKIDTLVNAVFVREGKIF